MTRPDFVSPRQRAPHNGSIVEPSEVPPAVTPHERSETDFTWNMGMERANALGQAADPRPT